MDSKQGTSVLGTVTRWIRRLKPGGEGTAERTEQGSPLESREYDPETGSWQAWSEERRTTVETVDALLVTIADWSTDIGENDRLSPAGMHALLDSFK